MKTLTDQMGTLVNEFYQYYRAPEAYFWQWEDDAGVVAIPEGNTIAYKETIMEVLKGFENEGIPPFGTLLLVLIATNRSAQEDLVRVEALVNTRAFQVNNQAPHRLQLMKDALQFLQNVQALPAHYKNEVERGILIRHLLRDCHNVHSVRESSRLVAQLGQGYLDPVELSRKKDGAAAMAFLKEFRPLALLLRKYPNAELLAEKLHDMPDIQAPLDIEKATTVPQTGDPEDLVDELVANAKTFQVGALVKRIWSGLNIPYHLSSSGEQAVGGVSGLTNTGELDKLLLTEHANDDLMFLSRLANNESLYLRREAPPSSSKNKRLFLLDVTLKNWGVPKVMAHALTVAISNHPKNEYECGAFAVGDKVRVMPFNTVEQVANNITHLDPSLTAAKGLKFFLEGQSDRHTEVFFISSEEAVQYPEMQKVLSEHHRSINYWLSVDRSGGVKCYKHQFKSKHLVQQLQLPLEELWKAKPKAAVASAHKYPILNPIPVGVIGAIEMTRDRWLVITRGKGIWRMPDGPGNFKGLELLHSFDFINKACKFEFGLIADQHQVLLIYVPNLKQVHFYELASGSHHEVPINLSFGANSNFFFHEDRFYFATDFSHWEISYLPKPKVQKRAGFPEHLREAYQQRHGSIRPSLRVDAVLKNITNVFVNDVGNLVLNIHELRLETNGELVMLQTQFLTPKVTSRRDPENKRNFIFDGGNTLTIDTDGMLIFSSDMMDPFYIPSVLDSPLAAGTQNQFAGNTRYQLNAAGQEVVNMKTFYRTHVQPFVDNLMKNGNNT